MKYAIIGGTGIYNVEGDLKVEILPSQYGSVEVEILKIGQHEIIFLPRHGKGHSTPPHLINYQANMMALKNYGVTHVLATCAVGSCNLEYEPGDVVELVDFLDFTKSRPHTFHDGSGGVKHTDMSDPYCSVLRQNFEDVACGTGLNIKGKAVYVCTEGPRFETASEIQFYKQIGGDVVGMTNVPEVILAKELGMCYAAYGIVSNWCTGFKSVITIHDIHTALSENKDKLTMAFIQHFKGSLNQEMCRCLDAVFNL